jgi:hypothetical protein
MRKSSPQESEGREQDQGSGIETLFVRLAGTSRIAEYRQSFGRTNVRLRNKLKRAMLTFATDRPPLNFQGKICPKLARKSQSFATDICDKITLRVTCPRPYAPRAPKCGRRDQRSRLRDDRSCQSGFRRGSQLRPRGRAASHLQYCQP